MPVSGFGLLQSKANKDQCLLVLSVYYFKFLCILQILLSNISLVTWCRTFIRRLQLGPSLLYNSLKNPQEITPFNATTF